VITLKPGSKPQPEIGVGGPPAADSAAYQAMAALPGITVQQGITDTAGGQAIGVSADGGGYNQLLGLLEGGGVVRLSGPDGRKCAYFTWSGHSA
jgi:hypothetical protein